MQRTFILILLILLIVVVFSLQNPFPVYISLWFWQVEANLPLLMIIAVLSGALLSYLMSLPSMSKKNREIQNRDQKIREMEDETSKIKMHYVPETGEQVPMDMVK